MKNLSRDAALPIGFAVVAVFLLLVLASQWLAVATTASRVWQLSSALKKLDKPRSSEGPKAPDPSADGRRVAPVREGASGPEVSPSESAYGAAEPGSGMPPGMPPPGLGPGMPPPGVSGGPEAGGSGEGTAGDAGPAAQVLKRGLFAPPQAEAQQPPPQVSGILGSEALVNNQWVGEGEKAGAWTVLEVEANRVLLEMDGRRHEVHLFEDLPQQR